MISLDRTVDFETIKDEIVKSLTQLHPDRVVLFGSHAKGLQNKESDIDLYVVTNDDFIPSNWQERNKLYLNISKRLRKLREYIAIDLIVHTKKMYEQQKQNKGSFFKYDIEEGLRLL